VNLSVWNVLAVSKQSWEGETIRRWYRRYLRIIDVPCLPDPEANTKKLG
jgi:hypothetical protein